MNKDIAELKELTMAVLKIKGGDFPQLRSEVKKLLLTVNASRVVDLLPCHYDEYKQGLAAIEKRHKEEILEDKNIGTIAPTGKCFSGCYIGPEISLRGEGALITRRGRRKYAVQFNNHNLKYKNMDVAFGWHEFPRSHFAIYRNA